MNNFKNLTPSASVDHIFNKMAIDLSLLPVDMVPLTDWSIYPGQISDHLTVLLEIQHQHNTERVSVPKIWLTQHTYWEIYLEHITTATTNMEWTYINTNKANITKTRLEAVELYNTNKVLKDLTITK